MLGTCAKDPPSAKTRSPAPLAPDRPAQHAAPSHGKRGAPRTEPAAAATVSPITQRRRTMRRARESERRQQGPEGPACDTVDPAALHVDGALSGSTMNRPRFAVEGKADVALVAVATAAAEGDEGERVHERRRGGAGRGGGKHSIRGTGCSPSTRRHRALLSGTRLTGTASPCTAFGRAGII
jgi:hypothetical protein